MNARPATARPSVPPVKPVPAEMRLPLWEQLPAEKRQELTDVLADMLIRKLQSLERQVGHEPAS